jgi:hypothetical protein
MLLSAAMICATQIVRSSRQSKVTPRPGRSNYDGTSSREIDSADGTLGKRWPEIARNLRRLRRIISRWRRGVRRWQSGHGNWTPASQAAYRRTPAVTNPWSIVRGDENRYARFLKVLVIGLSSRCTRPE